MQSNQPPSAVAVSIPANLPPAPPAHPGVLRLLLVALLCALTWVAVDWLRAEPGSVLFPPALGEGGWHLAVLLLLILALTLLTRPTLDPRWAAMSVLGIIPVVLFLTLAIDWGLARAEGKSWWHSIAWWGVIGFASSWIAQRLLRLAPASNPLPLVLLSVIALCGLFGGLNHFTYTAPTLWLPGDYFAEDGGAEGESEAGRTARELWPQLEPILFAQPSRIDVALSQLAPPTPEPEAFFVGFAGYGEEKVFAEEIKFAEAVVAQRFGTADRSLLLINDQRDMATRPLASPSALSYALRQLGKRFDPEEDLLVLALSSHGSDHPLLAVSNGPVPVRDLSGAALKQALDRAGIRNRVLIISACFAGAFIDELATTDSIIITAAARDRTSFGCSNDRDLTYFGEAFLRDSLLYLPTLEQAFEQAKVLVTAREREIQMEPSLPAAHFGKAISARIGQWLRPPCEPAAPGQPHSSGCRSRSPDR